MRPALLRLWCSVALTTPVRGLSVTSLVQRASALPWSCAGELDGFAFDSAYVKDGQPRGWANWLVDGRLMLGQYPHCQPAEPGPSADDARFGADTLAVGEHTDYGFLTLLRQDECGGLEARLASGEWVDVPPVAGAIVVNLGDALEFWTNGNVRAARHRVRPAAAAAPRHSIVLFHAARDDADLAPLAHLVGPGGPCARYVAAKDDADAHDGAPGTLTQLRHLLRRVAAAEANGTAGDRATGA